MSQVTVAGNTLPTIPEFLKSVPATANEDLRSGIYQGVSFPRLSIKGKVFRIVKDSVAKAIEKKDEDGELVPVQTLAVVILGANKGLYKLYYDRPFNEDDEEGSQAPACYSYDGVLPSPMVTKKQSEACASCPRNVWGAVVNALGNKTKECSDNKLLAVMATGGVTAELKPDNQFGEVFGLKVTPSALNRSRADRNDDPQNPFSFAEYVDQMNKYPVGNGETIGVSVRAASTKLFFDTQAAHPLLRFKLGRFLTKQEYAYAELRAKGDDVKAIISENPQAVVAKPKAIEAPPKEDDGESLPPQSNGAQAPVKAVPAAIVDPNTGEVVAKRRGRPPAAEPAKETAKPVTAEMDEELAGLVAQFNK